MKDTLTPLQVSALVYLVEQAHLTTEDQPRNWVNNLYSLREKGYISHNPIGRKYAFSYYLTEKGHAFYSKL
jgi:hypothetical protein